MATVRITNVFPKSELPLLSAVIIEGVIEAGDIIHINADIQIPILRIDKLNKEGHVMLAIPEKYNHIPLPGIRLYEIFGNEYRVVKPY